ncbi:MAG: hypothetical protein IKK66_01780 [Ruminococcus sp.]|nr:hypothetical protein [Ruminococcus sp.]
MQHEKLTKGIFFGFIGNLLFVGFGLICLLFYTTYKDGSFFSRLLEALAYSIEFLGFGFLLYADWLLIKSVRMRNLLKISFTAYILLEAIMMILELNSAKIDGYEPYSLALAMVHAAVSGMACFAFLQLDPDNVKWEVAICACFTLIVAGMLGNILGIRIYFSIITNAIGFAVLFGAMKFFRDREEIDIDCYGDRASEAVFSSSTIFDSGKSDSPKAEAEEIEEIESDDANTDIEE